MGGTAPGWGRLGLHHSPVGDLGGLLVDQGLAFVLERSRVVVVQGGQAEIQIILRDLQRKVSPPGLMPRLYPSSGQVLGSSIYFSPLAERIPFEPGATNSLHTNLYMGTLVPKALSLTVRSKAVVLNFPKAETL